jgi:hypothetical protein
MAPDGLSQCLLAEARNPSRVVVINPVFRIYLVCIIKDDAQDWGKESRLTDEEGGRRDRDKEWSVAYGSSPKDREKEQLFVP